jgi:SGNH hydrolase-like domain, acetyltransferase AlgX
MAPGQPSWRGAIARPVKLISAAAALLLAFLAGLWINPREDVSSSNLPTGVTATYAASTSSPQRPKSRTSEPRQPERRATEERASVVRRDAALILDECRRAAAGDWDKWQRDTAPFRAALRSKIDALKDLPDARSPFGDCRYEPLEGLNGFPLFEIGARDQLNYLHDPASLDEFRRDRPVVAASRWLGRQGIDLIFVPVPKMTEVYVDHFLDPCPQDGIIAPHVRRTLLDLLKDDVEVVDGLQLFRTARDTDSEYLYNTSDTHWAPRGMRVMAKEIADRVQRYVFGMRARFAIPIVQTSPAPYLIGDYAGGIGSDRGWMALSPEQRRRAEPAQTTYLSDVRLPDGQVPPDDPASPVLVIGHSYVPKFREQLIKELNVLVATRVDPGQTTHAFADFVREPELLAHCRVVVWISTEQHMTQYAKLPEPVVKALASSK